MDIEKACKECYELGFLDAVSQRPDRGQDAVDCCAISLESAWDDSDAKKAAEAIAENLERLGRMVKGDQVVIGDSQFEAYMSDGLLWVVLASGVAFGIPELILQTAIKGGATVVLAGGE